MKKLENIYYFFIYFCVEPAETHAAIVFKIWDFWNKKKGIINPKDIATNKMENNEEHNISDNNSESEEEDVELDSDEEVLF